MRRRQPTPLEPLAEGPKHAQRSRLTLGAGLLAILIAAGCGGEQDQDSSEGSIIGGTSAAGAKFDAVGAIGYGDTTSFEYFCSATLISPTQIVTARHCAIASIPASGHQPSTVELSATYFAIGPNSKRPRRVVQIAAANYSEPPVSGWLGGPLEFGLGHDIAVMTLVEPVLDITPIPLSARPPRAGMRLTNVGYGLQSLVTDRDGTRRKLDLNVDTLSGAPGEITFPTFAAYLARLREVTGEVVVASQTPDRLRRDFLRPMSAFELYAGKDAYRDGGNSCFGDSGGPLIDFSDPQHPVVAAVTSGGFACERGGTYARADQPRTQALVSTDPCANIPAQGICSGEFVVSCGRVVGVARPRLRDCSRGGKVCAYDAMGAPFCADNAWQPELASCNARLPLDRPVTLTSTVGVPPPPRGGAPRDGTWVLAEHTIYDKEGDDLEGFFGLVVSIFQEFPERSTLYIQNGRIQMAQTTDTRLAPLTRYAFNQTFTVDSISAKGATLRMSCPLHETMEFGMTATDRRIDLYDYDHGGNVISVARYVPAQGEAVFHEPPATFAVPAALASQFDAATLKRIQTPEQLRQAIRAKVAAEHRR